ncbi:MAG TPA: BREX protein BrxB domain-containing protein [Polyangiaceae bacterium]|nr:BREX protein BrxB domain-containing protein [Polyangiaceae bacterium]
MTVYQHPTALNRALDALRSDLMRFDGPQISTVRNYNFAILPYDPEHEFPLREAIQRLMEELRDAGWTTGVIPLHSLLLARLRAQGSEFVEAMIAREKRLAASADPWRGLRTLKERVANLIEGPEGLAHDVIVEIERIIREQPGNLERTVILLGRAGALYPFLRTSALLKHLAGRTSNVPIVLLYPGHAVGETGLSFMGVMPADRDYRPRIYR